MRSAITRALLQARTAGPSRAFATEAILNSGVPPKEVISDIPPNVRFEGFENDQEPIVRGFRLHTVPTQGPIRHPLSSLASDSPLSPIPAPQGDGSSPIPAFPSSVALPQSIFALPLRRDILHRCVVWYLALLRQGNQSTKNRTTVNYSGRKLRQQKGTGKARVGDASSGTRRGGAPIHALNPRDHTQQLPRKVRALGLATALSSKLSSGHIRIVRDLNEAEWLGTAEARRALCDTEISRFGTPSDVSILFVHPSVSPFDPESAEKLERLENFKRAVRNMEGIEVLSLEEVQVWHVLKYQWTVLESGVVEALEPAEEVEEAAEEDEEEYGQDAEVEQEEEQRI